MSNPTIVHCLQSVPALAEQFSPGGNLIRPDWDKMAEAVEGLVTEASMQDNSANQIVARLREELGLEGDVDLVGAIMAALTDSRQALSDAVLCIAELERALEVQNAQLKAIAEAEAAKGPVPVADDAPPAW